MPLVDASESHSGPKTKDQSCGKEHKRWDVVMFWLHSVSLRCPLLCPLQAPLTVPLKLPLKLPLNVPLVCRPHLDFVIWPALTGVLAGGVWNSHFPESRVLFRARSLQKNPSNAAERESDFHQSQAPNLKLESPTDATPTPQPID